MVKIIRGWRQAEKRAGKGRVQLWRDVRAGLFPAPRQLGPNSIGWTEEEFTRREAAQQSLDVKRGRADIVLDGSGSTEALEAQVNQFWHTIVPAT